MDAIDYIEGLKLSDKEKKRLELQKELVLQEYFHEDMKGLYGELMADAIMSQRVADEVCRSTDEIRKELEAL